jgi:DNA-binding NtrC family response regulator
LVLAQNNTFTVKELPGEMQLPEALQKVDRSAVRQGVRSLDEMERVTILEGLAQCQGNKKRAADLLGI